MLFFQVIIVLLISNGSTGKPLNEVGNTILFDTELCSGELLKLKVHIVKNEYMYLCRYCSLGSHCSPKLICISFFVVMI